MNGSKCEENFKKTPASASGKVKNIEAPENYGFLIKRTCESPVHSQPSSVCVALDSLGMKVEYQGSQY